MKGRGGCFLTDTSHGPFGAPEVSTRQGCAHGGVRFRACERWALRLSLSGTVGAENLQVTDQAIAEPFSVVCGEDLEPDSVKGGGC